MDRILVFFKNFWTSPKARYTFVIGTGLIAIVVASSLWVSQEEPPEDLSMQRLRDKKILYASVECNSTDYFIYQGYAMGFQLELLERFAKDLGVKLQLKQSNSIEQHFSWLKEQKIDLIAANISITTERGKTILFSQPIFTTPQVLVQLKKNKNSDPANFIDEVSDLNDKSIYVKENSIYEQSLRNLTNWLDRDIDICVNNEQNEEDLITLVAEGKIPYTVTAQNIAHWCAKEYPNIDYHFCIGKEQKIAWAFRQSSDSLQMLANQWLAKFTKTKKFQQLYDKYYLQSRRINFKAANEAVEKGRISKYDELIKQYADTLNWDWRLLASLIYQESHFIPNLVSWAGAFGLMQLMPETAKRFNVTPQSSPEAQIRGGVRYIQWLDRYIPAEIKDTNERIKFILAAYNIGMGHILDARRLASKHGDDPNVWTLETEHYIKLKSKPKYYNDAAVRHGYARGFETFNFVREVNTRYSHYCNLIP
ncbi:MAG: transporter substrate-binding domain-containing protein [Bacteroidales bacterium]